jgi:hypothetical protein
VGFKGVERLGCLDMEVQGKGKDRERGGSRGEPQGRFLLWTSASRVVTPRA